MTTSSTPDPSGHRDCCRSLPQVVAAATGRIEGQALLDDRQWDGQPNNPQRQPQSYPHLLDLEGAADEVGRHEQPNSSAPIIRRYSCQVLQHEAESARAFIGTGARPAQVIQV
jgi:hypothetical protein